MELDLKNIESKLDLLNKKLDTVIEQNKNIQNVLNNQDDVLSCEIDKAFDRLGGDDLGNMMDSLKKIDFETVIYLCDRVSVYRQGGWTSMLSGNYSNMIENS